MSDEHNVVTEFQETTEGYWATRNDYNTVNAILLCWQDDDLEVRPEINKLQELFEQDFKFKTKIYTIPSEAASAQLQLELAVFIKQFSLQRKSLTIVYYAGHADKVEVTSPAGYSVWRAKEKGGATLNWFELQYTLYAAQGDVLVILDCCHAALKTRGLKDGKMEILAACASGTRVPEPGRLSFTSVLIRQIRKQLKTRESMSVKWLHTHLWGDKTVPSLTETPIYFDLSEHDQRSIVLKPLLAAPPAGFSRKQKPVTSFLFLKVSLADDPTGLQIANWLKSFPPAVIQGVDIEGLVLKARNLESLTDHSALFPGSILGKLSASAQKEILERLTGLSQTISTTAVIAKTADADLGPTNSGDAPSEKFASDIVNDLKTKVLDVCSGIEGSILLDPRIDLQEAAKDEVAMAAEAQDAITLRQSLLHTSPTTSINEVPVGSLKFTRFRGALSNDRFRYAQLSGKPVVVESFKYSTPADSIEPSATAISALYRMVGLLSRPKRPSFHILPCIGYTREPHVQKLGIIYDVENHPPENNRPMTLHDLISSRPRVPLGDRMNLAYALATALENFHRVGWIHKELRSEMILLFRKEPAPGPQDIALDIDASQPYLCGFEGSRPEDEDTRLDGDFSGNTNAYRHPERWGQPTVKFRKAHDVYALGILLLEIAYWRLATKFEEMRGQPLRPEEVKKKLLGRATDLAHIMGQSYARVVNACLRFAELSTELNDYDTHKVFEARILFVLKRATKLEL